MGLDIDKKILSKRHEELLTHLNRVTNAIQSIPKSEFKDQELILAISNQTKLISDFLLTYNQYESTRKNGKDISDSFHIEDSFKEMSNNILHGLSELKEILSRPVEKPEWVHSITRRDMQGRAQEIVSTIKI